MNDASVPGDGVVREATETGTASSLVTVFTPLKTPRSSKVSTTTAWIENPEGAADAGTRHLGDVKPGVLVEGRPLGWRSDQRGDVGLGRSPRHELL